MILYAVLSALVGCYFGKASILSIIKAFIPVSTNCYGDKTESDSIANQRTLLEAYAIDHPELCIVDEFVDDGYSGSNFERPAFQNLFRELEQGTINCILVKDLSRFGRNYIEVGRYAQDGKVKTIIVKDFSRFARDYIEAGDYMERIHAIRDKVRFSSISFLKIVLHSFAQNNDLVRIFRSIFFALVDKLRTKS